MVSRGVILSAAKDPGIYFQRNTEMLRFALYRTVRGFAQHDNSDFFSNLLETRRRGPKIPKIVSAIPYFAICH